MVRGTRKKRERQRNGVLIWIFHNCCVVEVTVVSDEVSSAGLMVVITVIMLQVAAITSGPHLGHPTPPLPRSLCSLQYTMPVGDCLRVQWGHPGRLLSPDCSSPAWISGNKGNLFTANTLNLSRFCHKNMDKWPNAGLSVATLTEYCRQYRHSSSLVPVTTASCWDDPGLGWSPWMAQPNQHSESCNHGCSYADYNNQIKPCLQLSLPQNYLLRFKD